MRSSREDRKNGIKSNVRESKGIALGARREIKYSPRAHYVKYISGAQCKKDVEEIIPRAYPSLILLVEVSRVFHYPMIREFLEGLLSRERQNFPQRNGERPDVAFARVPPLRNTNASKEIS